MHQHSHYRGPRRKREREKGPEKILEEIIAENSLTWERKQSAKSRKSREFHRG